jgi:hypothetical protein
MQVEKAISLGLTATFLIRPQTSTATTRRALQETEVFSNPGIKQ